MTIDFFSQIYSLTSESISYRGTLALRKSVQRLLLLFVSILLLTACGTQVIDSEVEFIAHRGASADAPENTMAAFQLAWERDIPAIELDVHLTKDNKLIVIHDANTERTTGVSRVVKESPREELLELDAGQWKDSKWAGEKLPTLEEALATIPEDGRCFVEIKVGPEAIPALVKAVEESGKSPEQLAIISFHAETVAEAKRQLPDIKAYYLSSFQKDEATGTWTPGAEELIERARSIGADGLDLAAGEPIDREFVKQVKAAGLELYVWTVDDPDVARRMIDAGVDGITSNRPAWLRQQIDTRSE